MTLHKKMSKILVTCGAALFLTTPILAGNGIAGNLANSGTELISANSDLLFLAGKGNGHGQGPGDGTGNDGNGPKDGTGYGPGDCTTSVFSSAADRLLARGGNGNGGGNGGHGPGDGTGNDGDGPKDGTGYGPGDGTGTCINS
jgi:hypothetical protein